MNTPTMQQVEDLRLKAEAAGYSLADVSRHAGIDPSQVSRYAVGKTIPLLTTMRKLEESVDSLIKTRLEAIQGVSEVVNP